MDFFIMMAIGERLSTMARRQLNKSVKVEEAALCRGARVTLRGEFSPAKMDARAGRVRGKGREALTSSDILMVFSKIKVLK